MISQANTYQAFLIKRPKLRVDRAGAMIRANRQCHCHGVGHRKARRALPPRFELKPVFVIGGDVYLQMNGADNPFEPERSVRSDPLKGAGGNGDVEAIEHRAGAARGAREAVVMTIGT